MMGVALLRAGKLPAAQKCFNSKLARRGSPWPRALMWRLGESLAIPKRAADAQRCQRQWVRSIQELEGVRLEAALHGLQMLHLPPYARALVQTSSGPEMLTRERQAMLSAQQLPLLVNLVDRRVMRDGKLVKLPGAMHKQVFMLLARSAPNPVPMERIATTF